jgi:Flp pilus assembly protein TadD
MARVQKQISLSPNNGAFYRELAILDFVRKDVDGARTAAQKAISLNAADFQSTELLSQLDLTSGQPDAALGLWQQWMAAHPKDTRATTRIAQIYEVKKDQKNAMIWYQKSLDLDPHNAIAQNNLAYMLSENNQDLDRALSLAQQARSERPEDPNTADTLAWVYFHKGMYSSARDLLENAEKVAPNNPSMEYHLGMVYAKLGDRANASSHLKKAVAAGQNTPVAQQATQALSSLG